MVPSSSGFYSSLKVGLHFSIQYCHQLESGLPESVCRLKYISPVLFPGIQSQRCRFWTHFFWCTNFSFEFKSQIILPQNPDNTQTLLLTKIPALKLSSHRTEYKHTLKIFVLFGYRQIETLPGHTLSYWLKANATSCA